METAVIIAKIWSIYFILITIWCLVMRDTLVKLTNKIIRSVEYAFLQSLITVGLGIVLVVNYSYWVLDWRLMITIVHWIVFIKGLFLLFFPDNVLRITKKLLKKNKYISLIVINGIIGCYFIYFGFICSSS